MKLFHVTGIGEILWDMLPDGKELGGAPANFAYHAHQLGAESTVISAVGTDDLGNQILSVLNEKGIKSSINKTPFPTGTVTVNLHNGIPNYTIHNDVAWDNLSLKKNQITILQNTDAICFGTLAQRAKTSASAIKTALNLVPKHCLKIFDINLRQNYYNKEIIEHSLRKANILKINDEELPIIRSLFQLPPEEKSACRTILEKFELQMVALTLGSEGSFLITQSETSYHQSPLVKVVDTIGAGDSFTAALTIGLLQRNPLKQIHQDAAKYAAKVCTHKGATPHIQLL